jgi:hypothetical protein
MKINRYIEILRRNNMLDKFKYITIGLILGIGSTFGFSHAQEWLNVSKVNYAINVNLEPAQMGDTSILNYNGSTYLPIRKVSEITGLKIEWHEKEKMVNIVTPSPKIVEDTEKIEELKDLVKIINAHIMFISTSERLSFYNSRIWLYSSQVVNNNKPDSKSFQDAMSNNLKWVKDSHHLLVEYYNNIYLPIATARGYDLATFVNSINKLGQAYIYSEDAVKNINMYESYKVTEDLNLYLRNMKLSEEILNENANYTKHLFFVNKASEIK